MELTLNLEVFMLLMRLHFWLLNLQVYWPGEIGSAIEKIDERLGKPVVIMCDEVTAIQFASH